MQITNKTLPTSFVLPILFLKLLLDHYKRLQHLPIHAALKEKKLMSECNKFIINIIFTVLKLRIPFIKIMNC